MTSATVLVEATSGDSMSRPKKILILSLVTAFAVCLAWILGAEAGKLLSRDKSRSQEFTRSVLTTQLLQEMPLLVLGDTIPDHLFYKLDDSPVRLSEVLTENTLITFFDPTCDPCIREIEALAPRLASSPTLGKRMILISTSDNISLIAFQKEFLFPGTILRDYGSAYSRMLNIKGNPLNIIVDSRRVLLRVYAGEISVEEFDSVIRDE